MNLSPHFNSSEFACHCGCGASDVSPKLINLLELIRSKAGDKPITILSGRRCKARNEAVGGAPDSQHLVGKAADITIQGMTPIDVWGLARGLHAHHLAFIGGIGLYKNFVHIDVRENVARWNG